MRFRCVLLDIDGTLVDSNDAHAHAWVEAFAESGWQVPFERVRPLIGKGGDKLLAELANLDSESAAGKAIAEARRQIFKERHLRRLRPTHGAKELLLWLREQPIAAAIASSAKSDEIHDLLAVVDAVWLADDASSADDVDNSKPDPDVVAAALKKAKCRRQEAVLIGDTPYDVEAARRAGIPAIAVRCGGWHDAALKEAIEIYDDPAQLVARWSR